MAILHCQYGSIIANVPNGVYAKFYVPDGVYDNEMFRIFPDIFQLQSLMQCLISSPVVTVMLGCKV